MKAMQIDQPYVYTVQDLKKALEGVPDDYPVLIQRMEDIYFSQHGWESIELIFERSKRSIHHSEYVPSAFSHTTNHENRPEEQAFVIEAHY